MIRTQGKIATVKGIDSFQSRELMKHSRDNETTGDTRHRCKEDTRITQDDAS